VAGVFIQKLLAHENATPWPLLSHPATAPISKPYRRTDTTYLFDLINALPTAPIILASLILRIQTGFFLFFTARVWPHRPEVRGDEERERVFAGATGKR